MKTPEQIAAETAEKIVPILVNDSYLSYREDAAKLILAALTEHAKGLGARIPSDNKAYGCELRDPNGTIWEYAETLKKRVAELELQTFDIKKLEMENARLQMEVDGMCSAEELRQVRASNAELVTKCGQFEKDRERLEKIESLMSIGAGVVEFGITEDGQAGVWLHGNEKAAGVGNTVIEAIDSIDAARSAQPAANTGDNHRTEDKL